MTNFNELDVERRLLVLRWAQESIDSKMKQQFQSKSYAAFIACLKGTRDNYDLEQIWGELPEQTRELFDHGSGILLDIEQEIEDLEDDLNEPELQGSEEVDTVDEIEDPFSDDTDPPEEKED